MIKTQDKHRILIATVLLFPFFSSVGFFFVATPQHAVLNSFVNAFVTACGAEPRTHPQLFLARKYLPMFWACITLWDHFNTFTQMFHGNISTEWDGGQLGGSHAAITNKFVHPRHSPLKVRYPKTAASRYMRNMARKDTLATPCIFLRERLFKEEEKKVQVRGLFFFFPPLA